MEKSWIIVTFFCLLQTATIIVSSNHQVEAQEQAIKDAPDQLRAPIGYRTHFGSIRKEFCSEVAETKAVIEGQKEIHELKNGLK